MEPSTMTDYQQDASSSTTTTTTTPKAQLTQSHEGEHHQDFGQEQVPISRAVKIFALCAAMNSLNLGYDIGVSTGSAILIQAEMGLTDIQRELYIGCLNLFSVFGAISSQYFSDRMGRRITFVVAAVGFVCGMIVMAISTSYTVLMVGRAFVGIGVGLGLAIDPLYISEMSPASHRGQLVTFSEIGINVGMCLGFSTGLILSGLSDNIQWRVSFAIGCIFPLVVIYLALKVMPETPRWLALKYRYEEARTVLQQIYPPGYNVDLIIEDIKESLERERLAEKTLGWAVLFKPTPAFRRMLVVGIGIAMAQQLAGIDAIQYYLLDILDESISSRIWQNVMLLMLGLIKLVCIFVGGWLFDYRGRRPLVYVSLVGMSAAMLLMSITFFASGGNPSTALTVIGLALYLAFFSFGMGPAAWLVPAEVFATCIRAKAMSLAAFFNRLTATAMSSTLLTQKAALSWAGFFLALSFMCMLLLVFLYCYLPETKGRSLEDMSLYFAEITGDYSILDAERKIRVEQELQQIGGTSSSATAEAASEEPAAAEGGTMT